jgi:hypothetical protein
VRALAACVALLVTATASAQSMPQSRSGPEPGASADASTGTGFTLAVRASAAIPFGDAYRTVSGTTVRVGDDVAVAIPLQLDAGIRIAGRFFVGAYGQYGWGILQSGACPTGVTCEATVLRVGVELLYSFHAAGSTPWIGVGSGWEWATLGTGVLGTQASLTLAGWEFGHVQLGYDFAVSPVVRIGPFAMAGVGQYSTATGGVALHMPIYESVPVPDRTIHGWAQLGVRSVFDFP